MKKIITFFALLLFVSYSWAQTYTPNKNAHSHNDYYRNQPFHDAYSNRFGSIEADIFLIDGGIYVAHDRDKVNKDRTFEALYLTPLLEQIKLNGGKTYPEGGSLQLLIDLKTEGMSTLKALESLLKPYRHYFDTENNPEAVRLVISGDAPKPEHFAEFDKIFLFDGNPNIHYTSEQAKRVGIYSKSFSDFSKWNGLGRIPEAELEKIEILVKSIHDKGYKLRFWGNPDTKTCWQAFIKLGIDIINTDSPSELAKFLNNYQRASYTLESSYPLYSPTFKTKPKLTKPKNVILLISDGAGFSQIWAAATANRGKLNVTNCKHAGFIKTAPSND